MATRGLIKRYYLILEKLKKNPYSSLKVIITYLTSHGHDVSKRTIERDFEAIRYEYGVSIAYNGNRNGYYIDTENSLDIDSFLRFLEMVNTADLLTSSLSESKENLKYISFDSSSGHSGIEHLGTYLSAIRNHRIIKFNHYNYYYDTTSKYTIKPYLVKEYQNRWYIIGLTENMSNLRTFGIDRISDLELTDQMFKPDPQIDAKGAFDLTIGITAVR